VVYTARVLKSFPCSLVQIFLELNQHGNIVRTYFICLHVRKDEFSALVHIKSKSK